MSRESMIKKQQFFYTMSAKDYQAMINGKTVAPKESKYHAQKVEVDGIKFDSKKESRQWKELCMLEASGGISNLRRQVSFELQPKYTNNKGEHIRAINYVADFVYEKDGKTYVQDTKGVRTDVFKIKKKLFEAKFKDYIFLES
jgi:hypothetical protein